MRRSLVRAALLGLALVLLLATPALADHDPRSSVDLFAGIGFDVGHEAGPLARAHPPAHYKLDINVGDPGVLDVERNLEKLLHVAAAAIWNLTVLLTMGLISIFMWAFSLNLLERGLGGMGEASDILYRDALGREWMVVAILLAGLWGIWKALVQRRYAESAGAIAVSVCFAVIALFFVYRPVDTVTQASAYGDRMSNAFLSVASVGPEAPGGVGPRQPGAAGTTKAMLSDRLFKAFVLDPWVVLNFGGLEHCVDARDQPAGRSESGRSGIRCIDHRSSYAAHWLRWPPYSDERKAEYEALNRGKAPEPPGAVDRLRQGAGAALGEVVPGGAKLFSSDGDGVRPAPGQFDGRSVSPADEPAVDIQQAGAGLDRLALSLLVIVGNLGAVVLLGALSLGIVLAQVIALLLVAFAPVALIAGIFPGRGHDFFRAWLRRLVEAVLRKAVYSLLIAVILAVLSALFVATAALPWGVAFAFQSAFLWMLFLGRHQIASRLSPARAEGGGGASSSGRAAALVRGPAGTLSLGAAGAVGYGARRAEQWHTKRREAGARATGLADNLNEGPRGPRSGPAAPTGSATSGRPDGGRTGSYGSGAPPGRPHGGTGVVHPSTVGRARRIEASDDGAGRVGGPAGGDTRTAGAGKGGANPSAPRGGGPRSASPGEGARSGASPGESADRPVHRPVTPSSAPAGQPAPDVARASESPADLAAHAERRILGRPPISSAPPRESRRRRAPWSGLRGRP